MTTAAFGQPFSVSPGDFLPPTTILRNQQAEYVINGKPNTVWYVEAFQHSDNNRSICIYVTDSGQNPVPLNSTNCSSAPEFRRNFATTRDGRYTIKIGPNTSVAQDIVVHGNFGCSGNCVAGPTDVLRLPRAEPRDLQQNFTAEGTVRQDERFHVYRVYALDKQQVNVTVLDLDSDTPRPCIRLYTPKGSALNAFCTNTTAMRGFTANEEGVHFAWVEEDGNDHNLRYRVSVACTPNCVHPPPPVTPDPLFVNPAVVRLTAIQGSREIQLARTQVTGGGSRSFEIGVTREPWLSVSPTGGTLPVLLQVQANPRDLPVGVHRARVSLRADSGVTTEVPVEFEVREGKDDGSIEVDAADLDFRVTGDAEQDGPQAKILTVRSAAKSDLAVEAEVKNGSSWLTVSPARAVVSPGQAVEIILQFQPQAFPAGLVEDVVVITAGGTKQELPIRVNIFKGEAAQPLLSTKEVTLFVQVEGEGSFRKLRNVSDQRSVMLYNLGPGGLDWFGTAEDAFLQLTPVGAGQKLSKGEFKRLTIFTNPLVESLKPAEGLLKKATEAVIRYGEDWSDKIAVHLRFHRDVPPRVTEAGIVLGAGALARRDLEILHSESNGRSFEVRLPPWLEFVPETPGMTLPKDRTPFKFALRMKPGVVVEPGTRDDVSLSFSNYFGLEPHVIHVSVIAAGDVVENRTKERTADACQAKKLFAVFSTPGNMFRWEAGVPLNIEARIVDNCGESLVRGGAMVSFSNGDAPVALQAWPDGFWRGTWTPSRFGTDLVRLRLAAADTTGLFTQAVAFGTVNTAPPEVTK